ncbi:MAG: hypothetical protein LQ340_005850 [Diploschistes diacapsis]|nr:MAG: hypothetical protein LQ340_005850 [Diploschistes diacapsis]
MAITTTQSNALPPDSDAGPGILVEVYILLIMAFVLVGLRCYVRLGVRSNWGWDDSMIIIALIFWLIGAILVQLEVNLGSGRHLVYVLDPEQAVLGILKLNTFFQMDNVLCTLFTKISISIYIVRIKNEKWLRRMLWVLMVLMFLATLICIIGLSISCIPLEALWNPAIKGKCLPLQTVYIVSYVQSAFTIITDLCFTVSPIAILWNVQIRKGRKVLICFLMSLGLVATISNALRNVFVPDLTSPDLTHAITPITIVAVLELSSGIIAACIPACMPLFQLQKIREQQSDRYLLGNRATKTTAWRPKSRSLDGNETLVNDDSSLSALHTKTAVDVVISQV